MNHLFELKLKEYPRTWTKKQWVEVYRYLRECRRKIEKELNGYIIDF